MSNNRIAEYIVRLVGQNTQLMGQINQANVGLQNMTNQAGAAARANIGLSASLKNIATAAAGAFSVVEIGRFMLASIRAYDLSEAAQAKVAQAIKTTGGVAGQSLEELTVIAAKFQKSTLFEDDAIMNGVTAQLLTFTNIAGDNFRRTQVAALDLATVLGGDLQGVSIQLGKALNDPVQGLSALGRSGISFTNDQKEVIKNLTETNRLAEAQSLILNELERQYGGQAEAAAKASSGLVQFNNALGDAQEQWGKSLANSTAFKEGLDDTTDILYTWSNDNISTWQAIGITLDKALWGTHGDEFLKRQRLIEQSVDDYSAMEARAQAQGKRFTAVNQEKETSLNSVTAALAAAKEAQGEVNVADSAAVANSRALVSSLTAQKEALEKLYQVTKPREKVKENVAMTPRLDVMPVVSLDKNLYKMPALDMSGVSDAYDSASLREYVKQMDITTQRTLMYGNVLDTIADKKAITQAAIDGLLNEGYGAESVAIQGLMQLMGEYDAQQMTITGNVAAANEAIAGLGISFSALGSAIGGAAGSWIGFAGTLLTQIPTLITQITALTAAQTTGAAVTVAAGAAEVATSSTVTSAKATEAMTKGVASGAGLPFPGNLIAIAAIIASIGAIISAIPKPKKFATGGIVSGPTLGMVGEYAGASNNPEVIAPLSKLKGMLADNSGMGRIEVADIIIDGNKLRYILKVADRQSTARN